MPTTMDDFYEVLKAFKEQDPNGNGIADELPISGYKENNSSGKEFFRSFYGSWGFGGNSGIIAPYMDVDDEGKVRYIATDDTFKDMLTFFNKLWAEGLIDKEIFSPPFTSTYVLTGKLSSCGFSFTELEKTPEHQWHAGVCICRTTGQRICYLLILSITIPYEATLLPLRIGMQSPAITALAKPNSTVLRRRDTFPFAESTRKIILINESNLLDDFFNG